MFYKVISLLCHSRCVYVALLMICWSECFCRGDLGMREWTFDLHILLIEIGRFTVSSTCSASESQDLMALYKCFYYYYYYFLPWVVKIPGLVKSKCQMVIGPAGQLAECRAKAWS